MTDHPVVQIVDDSRAFALGLTSQLSDPSFELQLLESVSRVEHVDNRASVILCDLSFGPNSPTLESLEMLRTRLAAVVAMTGYVRRDTVIADTLSAGCLSFITKHDMPEPSVVAQILRLVSEGNRIVTSRLALALLRDHKERPLSRGDFAAGAIAWLTKAHLTLDDPDFLQEQSKSEHLVTLNHIWTVAAERSRIYNIRLTAKQFEVAELLIKGWEWKDIAVKLCVGQNAVEKRMDKLRDKWLAVAERKAMARRDMASFLYREHIERYGRTFAGSPGSWEDDDV